MLQFRYMKKFTCQFFGVFPIMKDYVRSKMSGFHLSISDKELLSPDDAKPDTEVLGVFVGSKVDEHVFDHLPRLKLIVTMSTGFDHIDLVEAKKRSIPVCNVPTYGENTVAEHAMSLILALSRKLFPSVKRVKEGSFNYEGLRGFDLKGKTLGVVGTGHIGAHVIRMAKSFEMDIVAFDAFPNPELAKKLGFTYLPLEELLAASDVITLHLPLFKETEHIINKTNIKKVKKGAYIVNTARGGLIESEALVWGLENGQIAGAGLDVLEEEDSLSHPEHLVQRDYSSAQIKTALMSNILIDHPNVIITPHNAFNSMEALQRIMDTTIENVKAFAAGKTQNDVTAPKPQPKAGPPLAEKKK
jgi:D-lactate dehydrogenase